jgi:DNA repair exonuclease SbcCD nuclease subunit
MTTPVFIHASDLHLGQPLYKLGKGLGEAQVAELNALAKQALVTLVTTSIERKAEFVLLAGDIYDDAERERSAQLDLFVQLRRLEDHNIRVYIVHGNHDPSDAADVAVVGLPSNVHVFQPSEPEVIRHELRDGGHVYIAGVSFSKRHEEANLAKRISAKLQATDTKGARAVIAVLHTNVGGSPGHLPYAPCSVDDLNASPVHYWALGHVHKRREERMGPNRFWAYPGNLQGRFANEDGPKGALVVPILDNGVGKPEFVPCDSFRFLNIEVDCSSLATLDKIAAAVTRQVQQDTEGRRLIVSLTLTGTSSEALTVVEKGTKDGEGLVSDLQKLLVPTLNGGYLQDVSVNILPELDYEQLSTRDDVIGDLLRALESGELFALVNEFLQGDIDSKRPLTDTEVQDLRNRMKREFIRQLVLDMGVAKS